MKKLGLMLQALGILLGILFLIGGIVPAVWLLIIGHWEEVALGILAALVDTLVIGILLAPTLLLAAAAVGLIRKHNVVASLVVTVLGQLYTTGVVAAWCFGVLWFFTSGVSANALVPTLFWSFLVALGPWEYLASKEEDNPYSAITTMVFGAAYIVNIVMILFGHGSVKAILGVFGVAMLLVTVVNSGAYAVSRAEEDRQIDESDG
jgi:hypothetical protein